MNRLVFTAVAATLLACGGPGNGTGGGGGSGGGFGGGFVGGGAGGGQGCNGTSCNGTVAQWCSGTQASTLDCSMLRDVGGALSGGQCSTGASFGAWCAVGMGKTCVLGGQARNGYLYCGDATGPSATLGCDLDNGCTPSTATCTSDAGSAPTCQGDQLVVDCTAWGQPVVHSCTSAAIGGTGCQAGACVGIPDGRPCGATLQCAAGSACNPTSQVCESFTPGPHSAAPQVVTLGGPVLTAPKVKAITWTADPNGATADAFDQELINNPYWPATTAEYGVGALAVSSTVHPSTSIPANLTDAQVQSMLSSNLSGSSPAWGAPDKQTIYMVLVPQSTNFDDGTGAVCCTDYGGYHDDMMVGTTDVPYAIICACPDFDYTGETVTDAITATVSHELVEAATDPYVENDEAYAQTDDDHAAWTLVTGGEVADMCSFNPDFEYLAPGRTYKAQRSWSNAAATAGLDPCVPARTATPTPFANAVPVISGSGTVSYYGTNWATKAVTAPVNSMTVVDVQAFSSAPMGVPFSVTAYDLNSDWWGGQTMLRLTLDQATATNGDTLHLTINPARFDNQLGPAAIFLLQTDWDGGSALSMGSVVP